jgi:hypothetical protein
LAKSRGDDPERSRAKRILLSLSAENAELLYNRLTSGSRQDDFTVYFKNDANVPPAVRSDLLSTLRTRFAAPVEPVAVPAQAATPQAATRQAATPTKAEATEAHAPPPEGTSGLLRWPAAPDAFHGIVPYYAARAVPETTFSPARAPLRGPYRIAAQLRHGAGGTVEVVYFVAFRVEPGLIGPTNWDEYVIGPDSIDEFILNLDKYRKAGAGAYMFGPPSPSAVEGRRFVEAVLRGQPQEAVDAYKSALYEAVTDPGWWIQMVTALSSLARPPLATPRAPFVPRVIQGGGVRVAASPPTTVVVGNTALKLEPIPGIAARLQSVPAPAVAPALTPAVPVPMSPALPAVAVAAASLAVQSPSQGQAPSTSTQPAPAPAPNQPQQQRPSGVKVADSNIFQDRPERNTRATIDALYLANPALTFYVPAAAILEVTQNDPYGTQRARLAGLPGGAKIVPDVDGNVVPLVPLFPNILSSKFGEADLRIALRAKERALPLLTAQAALAAQVRDANFPERVKAVGSVVVEVVP